MGSVHAASASARARPKSAMRSRPVVAEEEVGGLDVAVDEAPAVGVVEAAGRLEADQQRLRRAEPPAHVEHRPQAAAAEVLAHEVRPVVLLAPVVDRHDVGVVEGGGGPGLGPEPAQERLVVGQRRVQDLDRDAAAQPNVVGEEDVPDEPLPTGRRSR